MKAVICNGNMDIRVENIEKPKLLREKVLVKITMTGICGSDIQRVLSKTCPVYPTVLGHEFCGMVEAVGEGVTTVKPGDFVAGIPLVPCFQCEACRHGNYGQCADFKFVGTKVFGGMAEYVCVLEKNVLKLEKDILPVQGAMFEPMTVAVHGVLRMEPKPGKTVAVVGAGTIGIFVIQFLRTLGMKTIIAIDLDDNRLELAAKYGADICINSKREKVEEMIRCRTGNGADYVVECVGISETEKMSLHIVGPKGILALIGLPGADITFSRSDFELIARKELTLMGTWMSYSQPFPGIEWEIARQLNASGKMLTEGLVEAVISLEEVPGLFKEIKDGRKLTGKIMVKPEGL